MDAFISMIRRIMRPSWLHEHAFSLRLLIGFPVMLFTVLSTGLAAWLAIDNGRVAVDTLAYQLRTNVLLRIEERLASYLAEPLHVNAKNAQALRTGLLSLDDPRAVQRYFHSVISTHPALVYSYFGTVDGEFYGARRLPDGAIEVVRAGESTGGESRYFSTSPLGDALEQTQVYPDFDPGTRPWFNAARQAQGPVWTLLYRHFVIPDLALTAALAVRDAEGELLGVFGVDYLLTRVRQFLRGIELSPHAHLFILSQDGRVVAASTDPDPGAAGSDIPQPVQAINSTQPVIATAARELDAHTLSGTLDQETLLNFQLDGESWYLQAANINLVPGLKWTVAVAVPEKDFMGLIHAHRRQTLLIIALVLLLAVGLGVLMATRIIAPMQRLTRDAERLAQGNWVCVPKPTPIREFNRLDRAFETMACQLREQFEQLHEQAQMISEHNQVLERRVIERTADLNKTMGRLRAFFENIPGYIIIVDADFHIISVSRGLLELYGISDDQPVIGRTCHELFWQEAQPCETCELPEVFSTQCPRLRYSSPREEERFQGLALQIFSGPILDPDGALIGGMIYCADISDLRAMERQLITARESAESANAAKSDFLARMSHEIRTPMNAVLGLSELLLLEGVEGRAREFVQVIQQSTRHLLGVINDILDLSKIEARQLELVESDFDLCQTLNETLAALRVAAERKGLRLSLECDPGIEPIVRADRQRLTQVLINLVGNAIKFTDQGGVVVRVWTHPLPDRTLHLGLAIADTGAGIPEVMRLRIFDAFTQVDESAQRRYGGTGLGLAISRQLIEMMDGDIAIDSQLGQGSVFHCRVRIAPGDARRIAPDSVQPEVAVIAESPGSLCILLVEDTPANVLVAEQLLRRLGHVVKVATDAHSALEQLGGGHIDLVLMDVEMPGMNGFEATERIRAGGAGERARDLPVIGLTAHALNEYRERGLRAGMSDYVFKPVSLDALASAIARVMQPKRDAHVPEQTPVSTQDSDDHSTAIDLELVLTRFAGDTELLVDMLDTMLSELPEKQAQVMRALSEGDVETAGRIAHSLKSHLATLGAESARACARGIEELIEAGDCDQALARRDELDARLLQLYRAVLPALQAQLGASAHENATLAAALAQIESLMSRLLEQHTAD